ncbi:MAG: hypothetical protein HUU35_16865, partial [Armatimonadetes bacterium]|nr:hypothetical protein [Armatimonadota bacterium]
MNALAALLSLLLTAAPPAEQLGRQVKLKILVDKVLQQHGKWVTEEWMVKESAAAGFNVYSPRRGFDDLAAVKQVTAWCAAADIYHLVWMRGTLDAPAGAESAGRRLVWASGVEQALWSPNSDEFWDWTTRYIVEYAKISATMPALLGVFLDYENYASNKVNNCYDLSYDQQTLQRFATAQKVAIPELPTTERKAWLEGKGLHEAFATWQVSQWRERCRKLRQAVDAHNPAFRFCIYPAPGTPFMVEATYPEWSTAAAPLILGDPWTYGRSSRFQPQDVALEANRQIMLRGQAIPKEKGIPYLYTGGIDPVVAGADPEFSGKNALMLAEVSDGYWIFYEGPTYTKDDHKEYWKWFTWANKAMDEGRFAAWRTPRETPEDWSLAVFDQMKDGPRLVAPPPPAAA